MPGALMAGSGSVGAGTIAIVLSRGKYPAGRDGRNSFAMSTFMLTGSGGSYGDFSWTSARKSHDQINSGQSYQ